MCLLTELSPLALAALLGYAGMSAITFAACGIDKRAARRGRRRVPEATLHLLALVGGWPGMLLAMPIFRHKRRERGFVAVVWLIALAHTAGWAWWGWWAWQ